MFKCVELDDNITTTQEILNFLKKDIENSNGG